MKHDSPAILWLRMCSFRPHVLLYYFLSSTLTTQTAMLLHSAVYVVMLSMRCPSFMRPFIDVIATEADDNYAKECFSPFGCCADGGTGAPRPFGMGCLAVQPPPTTAGSMTKIEFTSSSSTTVTIPASTSSTTSTPCTTTTTTSTTQYTPRPMKVCLHMFSDNVSHS